jgi:argininosuccinate lyase
VSTLRFRRASEEGGFYEICLDLTKIKDVVEIKPVEFKTAHEVPHFREAHHIVSQCVFHVSETPGNMFVTR